MMNVKVELSNLKRHHKCISSLKVVCEMPGLLTPRGTDISLLYIRSKQQYMRSIDAHKCFNLERTDFNCQDASSYSEIYCGFV